jgi:N-acetyl-D-muramate 6-phosphate phosphatase
MSEVRAVLFDLDGTLLDTAPDMAGALNELLAENGLSALPFASIRPSVSHGSTRLVYMGFPGIDAQRFAVLQRRYLDIYRARLSAETRLFHGMDEVLRTLEGRGLPAGIVTNKPAWLTDPLLDELGLRRRFACVVSGDTVSERKPHAMPMLHAAKLAGVAPESCLYIGDAERDVQAAHAARMHALVATYGYLGEEDDWRTWRADGSIDRPADLLAWLGTDSAPSADVSRADAS